LRPRAKDEARIEEREDGASVPAWGWGKKAGEGSPGGENMKQMTWWKDLIASFFMGNFL
jgi:hypothetical protein